MTLKTTIHGIIGFLTALLVVLCVPLVIGWAAYHVPIIEPAYEYTLQGMYRTGFAILVLIIGFGVMMFIFRDELIMIGERVTGLIRWE